MPFTISHAVAVLPLASARPRWLIPAALVIGAWVPDLPYFLPIVSAGWTHAASGPVTIDPALGLAVFVVWRLILQAPLSDLAPRWVRVRLPEPAGMAWSIVPGAVVSVVIGALTHVVWDTFTHPNRWGTQHVPGLTTTIAGLPLFKWLQFGSGTFGLVVLAWWCVHRLRRALPSDEGSESVGSGAFRRASWVAVAGAAVVAVALSVAWSLASQASLEQVVVRAVIQTIAVTAAVLVLTSIVWHAANRAQTASSASRMR